MASISLAAMPETFECGSNAGYSPWTVPGVVRSAGYYACRVRADGTAVIYWTVDTSGLYGSITASGGEGSLAELWLWWQLNRSVPGP